MKIKYVIHRSKSPFKLQKKMFQEIIAFYSEQYPGLQFIDKGLRFSAVYRDVSIDFDFGYMNMRYRDFSSYHRVISQGVCGLLAKDLNPGDIVLPESSDMLRINHECTKVRLYQRTASFCNRMGSVMEQLKEYEQHVDRKKIKKFVTHDLCQGRFKPDEIGNVESLHVKKNARIIESNSFFRPSELKQAKSLLKVGEERLPITNLQEHLQKHFDAVDCEAKQMIENVGPRLARFSIGLNKPYEGMELTDELRQTAHPGDCIPGFDEGKINYFLTVLFGYLLATEGRCV